MINPVVSFAVIAIDLVLMLQIVNTIRGIEAKTCLQIKLAYWVLATGTAAHALQFVPQISLVCSEHWLAVVSNIALPAGIGCVLAADRRAKDRNCCLHRFRGDHSSI